MTRLALRILVSALLVALLAAGASAQAPPENVKARPLSEAELTRYLATLEDLVELGDDIEEQMAARPDRSSPYAGFRHHPEVKKVLAKHDFTPDAFIDVHWNTMMAFMASEMQGREAEMAAAAKQQEAAMAAMKAQLPPEQYEQMVAGMKASQQMMEQYEDVPPENVALVKKHRATLEGILDR